jgi:hypothetical protein
VVTAGRRAGAPGRDHWHALAAAGTVVGMAKERTTKEQRGQERERQQQERIDAWVQRIVAEAPPLTHEQRAKLAVLLEPVRIKPSDAPSAAACTALSAVLASPL